MTTAAGELWYIYQQGSGSEESVSTYSLTALQIGGPPPKSCKIEVYGVNFDFNKSDIKLSGRRTDAVKTWLVAHDVTVIRGRRCLTTRMSTVPETAGWRSRIKNCT